MGPRCSSAETQVCHRSYIIAANGIPAKIIKCSKSVIAPQITSIVNMSLDQSVFPDKLKKAQLTPLYKKNDPLLKTNYRAVSVLSIFSKMFEKILEQQLSDFFENIFNPYLCAFRRCSDY
jgi:hypothetical protein